MKVDFTVTNAQPLSQPSDFTLPSEVDIRVGLYDESGNFPSTVYNSQVTTLNFQYDGTQTQTVTFDVDPATVSNERVFWGYKIEAPATIAGEDFDEGDLFLPVEEGVGNLYLYPVSIDDRGDINWLDYDYTYQTITGYDINEGDGTFSGSPFANSDDAFSSTEPFELHPNYAQFPHVVFGFVNGAPTQPPLGDSSGLYTVYGGNDIEHEYLNAIKVPVTIAEDTNEFHQIISQYPNLRLNARIKPVLEDFASVYTDAEETKISHINAGDYWEVYVKDVDFVNKDFFNVTMGASTKKWATNTDLSGVQDSTDLDGAATILAWVPFTLEFEMEVQNPTSGEWSIYTPRIRQNPANNGVNGEADYPIFFAAAVEMLLSDAPWAA